MYCVIMYYYAVMYFLILLFFYYNLGVATFVRDPATPCRAEGVLSGDGHSLEDQICCYSGENEFTADELTELDSEGRCVITEYQMRLVFAVCK